jgi:hypothetical protein
MLFFIHCRRRDFTGGAHTSIKPGDNIYRHLRELVDRTVTLRMSEGSDLIGKPKFVAKDCLLFEESTGKPLITVALAHIVLIRVSE